MTKLTIDTTDLMLALEENSGQAEWYLDRQTGELLLISLFDDQEEEAEIKARIEAAPERYLCIEPVSSADGWQVMADFIETVADDTFAERLNRAIHGRSAFRAFKDALLDQPDERERWFRFKDDHSLRVVHDWLEAKGIEATLHGKR